MSKIIGIASSDWHLHWWSQFNKGGARVESAISFITFLFETANVMMIPIYFPGDLFHTPTGIATKTFYTFAKLFNKMRKLYPKVEVIGIPGNHDQSEHSKMGNVAPNLYSAWCECFPETFKDASFKFIEHTKTITYGIPYISHNIGFKKFIKGDLSEKINGHKSKGLRVLLLHTDLPAALDPSGREVGQVENIPRNLGRFFKDWDFVLVGHIHKPQETIAANVIMLGSPYQQRRSDADCPMGYWLLYDDKTFEFKEYDAPQFKYYHEGDEHEDTDDYWTMIHKGIKIEKGKKKKFNPKMDRTKMAKKYVRAKGIEDKDKLNALINILNIVEE